MIKPRKDLTGKRFGKLTVIRQDEDYIRKSGMHEARWLCKCDCGKEKIVVSNRLSSGATQQCGCLRINDLTGRRFGRLAVLERFVRKPEGKKQYTEYRCKCNCSAETYVRQQNLTGGSVAQCGCFAIEETIRRSHKVCTYDLNSEDYGICYTNTGKRFIFDKEDYDLIKNYCWHFGSKKGHPVSCELGGSGTNIYLYRLVLGLPKFESYDLVVDHINGDATDNRKQNLRITDQQHNSINRKKSSLNTTGVSGITLNKNTNKWIVRIGYKGKRIYGGYFKTFEEAVERRNELEEKYFGEFLRKQGE